MSLQNYKSNEDELESGQRTEFDTLVKENSETKTTEDVIADIEKFMQECDNYSMTSQVMHKGKVFDSAKDLLKILDSGNNSRKNAHNSFTPLNLANHLNPRVVINDTKSPLKIDIKKRKNCDSAGSDKIPLKLYKQRKEEVKKSRLKPRKICSAQIRDTSLFYQLYSCKKLVIPNKRNPQRFWTHHPNNKHKARTSVVKILCDSVTARNVIVKREIIDLTTEDGTCCLYLKFGKETQFEVAETFEVTIAKANVVEEPDLNIAVVFTPQIEVHTIEIYVDLTEEKQEQYVIGSEKECANIVLPIVYNCHRVQLLNKNLEDTLHELELLSRDESTDHFLTYKLISKYTASLGCTLLKDISNIFVKNFNISRFLEILSVKLIIKYNVAVKPSVVGFYLYSMLNPNRECCNQKFAEEMLKQIESIQKAPVKEERNFGYSYQNIITPAQLLQLYNQIQQYRAICERQRHLMAFSQMFPGPPAGNEDKLTFGFPDMTKEVKSERLNLLQEGNVVAAMKSETEIICLIDD